MTIKNYLEDKLFFIMINLILFTLIAGIIYYLNKSIIIIFYIFTIWFLPIGSYIIIQFFKTKKYYDDIENMLNKLDKKYLIPEIIGEVDFIEGKMFNDVLKIISRDMHENINYYKNMQSEYREYIETWVHEIKTPIASTKLIIENNKSETTSKIDSQLQKVEGFIEQVLYYSRSEDVSKDYIIKETQLNEIVNKVIKKNYRDFINKKIKLEVKDINYIVYTDTKWAEFIINQIIGNSIKYSKLNKAKITIDSYERGNSIILVIEDNGVGIVDKDINRTFEKSFTGENGRAFGKSTGMGLYLCKKLCDKLGLGIKLESKQDCGTKVSIIFPKLKR